MTDLRPYQIDATVEIDAATAAGEDPLLVAPTGAGKTVIVAAIIKRAVANGQRVIVLAHRREIIAQTSLKLSAHGVEHGIIRAWLVMDLEQKVQVCSIQTLWARAMRTNRIPLPSVDLLIIDEAHHVPARTYRKIIEAYPNAILLGATATPCRGDGRGLGNFFDCIVETPQVAELIASREARSIIRIAARRSPSAHRLATLAFLHVLDFQTHLDGFPRLQSEVDDLNFARIARPGRLL
jgi:DNA repair protein RadD